MKKNIVVIVVIVIVVAIIAAIAYAIGKKKMAKEMMAVVVYKPKNHRCIQKKRKNKNYNNIIF